VRDGLAYSASSDAVLDRLLAVSDGSRLSENETFTDPLDGIEGEQLVLGYVDGGRLADRAEALATGEIKKGIQALRASLGGRSPVFGIGATTSEKAVEFDFVSSGVETAQSDGDGEDMLRD